MLSILKLIVIITFVLFFNGEAEGNNLNYSRREVPPNSHVRQQMIQEVKRRILEHQQHLAYNKAKLQAYQQAKQPQLMFDAGTPVNNPVTLKDVIEEMISRQMRQNALKQKLTFRSQDQSNKRRFKMIQQGSTQNDFPDDSTNSFANCTSTPRPVDADEEIHPIQAANFQQNMLSDDSINNYSNGISTLRPEDVDEEILPIQAANFQQNMLSDDSINNYSNGISTLRPEDVDEKILPIQAARFQQNMLSDEQSPF